MESLLNFSAQHRACWCICSFESEISPSSVGVSFNETFTEHLRQVVGLQGEYKIILLSWTTPAGGDPDNWNTVMQTPRGRLPRRGQGKSEGSDS